MSPVPHCTLALRNDRANRNVEARHAPERSRLRTKLPDALSHQCGWLRIDRGDVAEPRGGHANHAMFWTIMKAGGGKPSMTWRPQSTATSAGLKC